MNTKKSIGIIIIAFLCFTIWMPSVHAQVNNNHVSSITTSHEGHATAPMQDCIVHCLRSAITSTQTIAIIPNTMSPVLVAPLFTYTFIQNEYVNHKTHTRPPPAHTISFFTQKRE